MSATSPVALSSAVRTECPTLCETGKSEAHFRAGIESWSNICALPDMTWSFHFCGSYGLRADRRAEDVPGGDMKSSLIAIVIHKRFIYGRFNSARLSPVICVRVHAASRRPSWYAPRFLE